MFTKINELVWTDQKFRELSDDGRLLFIYILTCPHRNIIGLYFLPVPYGAFDLKWSTERFGKGLKELFEKGFINYNFNTNIVFIKNFLKYNPLENPNQVKGAIKALDKVPTNGVDTELIEYLESADKPFFKPLIEMLNKRLSKRLEEGSNKQVDVDVYVDVEEDVYVDADEEEGKDETAAATKSFKDVINAFDNNIHPIAPMEAEKLKEWSKDLDCEVIIKAIEEAVCNNGRTINYINAILNTWHGNGIVDIQGVEAYLRDRADKKRGDNSGQGNSSSLQSDKEEGEIEYDFDFNSRAT